MHDKVFKRAFIWMFANIFNKVKIMPDIFPRNWNLYFYYAPEEFWYIGLWLTHHAVYAGWGTCGVQCEGGKTQCIQVQILNKHLVSLHGFLLLLWTPGNIWNVVNADLYIGPEIINMEKCPEDLFFPPYIVCTCYRYT